MMKSKLIAVLLCVFALCGILSSCKVPVSSSSASSSISREELQIQGGSGSSTSSVPNSSSDNSNEQPKQNSSQNQTSQKNNTSSKNNNSSKNSSNSSSKQNSTQINPTVSSDPAPSSDKQGNLSTTSQKPVQNTVALPIIPIRADEYYGWQQLKKSGTKAEQQAYSAFVEAFGNHKINITFDFNITSEEVEKAFAIYKDDYPQHFWVGDASYTEKNGYVTTFVLTDIMLESDMKKIRQLEEQMISKANAILSKVNGSMPAVERERIIHDSLINSTKYDSTLNAENSHNACGALVSGVAVCEGYANAFQYLMRQAGVQCILVKGKYNGDSHEWNMVKIEGAYYHIDVTSDDPIVDGGKSNALKFNYFNLTEDEIRKDHIIEGNVYEIPKATEAKYNFFRYYGLMTDKLDVDFVAKSMVLSANNGYEYAHMQFNGIKTSDAINYIVENYNVILNKANESITTKKITKGNYIQHSQDADRNILSLVLVYE